MFLVETGESRTRPDTISEKSRLSYGLGRGGAPGCLIPKAPSRLCKRTLQDRYAQTLKSGSRLYREQARSRSHTECSANGKPISCDIPDEQMGR